MRQPQSTSNGKPYMTSVRIPVELIKKVKHALIDRDETLNSAISTGLELWLAHDPKANSRSAA